MLIGYFKNLDEIDKKAEQFNASAAASNLEDVEAVLRESDVTRETILERFRFAQSECEQIEQRIKNQVRPVKL